MLTLSYASAPSLSPFRYQSVVDVIKMMAEELPNKEILIEICSNRSRKVLTYKELMRKATTVGKLLLSKGISHCDSVGIMARSSIERAISEVAVLMTGAAVLYLNNICNNFEDALTFIKFSGCKALFLDPEETNIISGLEEHFLKYRTEEEIELLQNPYVFILRRFVGTSFPDLESILSRPYQVDGVILPAIHPESTAVVLLTSGNAKLVEFSHFALVNAARSGFFKDIHQTGLYFSDMPTVCLGAGVLNGILSGHTRLVTHSTFEGEHMKHLWQTFEVYKCQSAFLSSDTLLNLVQNKDDILRTGFRLDVIKTGGHILPYNFRNIPVHFCRSFYWLYGTMEIGGIASADVGPMYQVGDIGTLFPGVQIKVVGLDGVTLPCGVPGEVLAKSPSSFSRYRCASDCNKQAFTPVGWYRTGDVGTIDQNGNCTLNGRAREVIVTGTANVRVSVVQNFISSLLDIQDVFVHVVPFKSVLKEVCACLVLNEGSQLKIKDVENFCKSEFGKYGIAPQYYIRFNEFPRLPNGTLDTVEITLETLKRLGRL